jgi:hypothetical protein
VEGFEVLVVTSKQGRQDPRSTSGVGAVTFVVLAVAGAVLAAKAQDWHLLARIVAGLRCLGILACCGVYAFLAFGFALAALDEAHRPIGGDGDDR